MPTERVRVTLPSSARRPHQRVTGCLGYPQLVFNAHAALDLPASTRKRKLPRTVVDQLLELGGQGASVYLRQALRRDDVTVEDGQDVLDHVPGSLYGELLEHVELASDAPSKWLQLSPREMRDLTALGFEIERLSQPEEAQPEETAVEED